MTRKKISLSNHHSSFYTKAIEASIIALVILVPIAFYPYSKDAFLPAKELIAEVLVILSLMFWGFKVVTKEKLAFNPTPLNIPLLSFIIICILSLIWSNSFFVSLKELPLFLVGPLLYFIITNNISDQRQIDLILNVLLIIGGLFGIYGILQYNGIDFSFWIDNIGRQQVFGLFGNAGYFAGYLIFPLSIAIPLFFVNKNRNRKILLLFGILVMGTTLIVTFTRGPYLSIGVSLIFMFLLFLLSRGKSFINENKKIFITVLIAIIIVAFLFIIPTPLSKSRTVISQIKARVSITRLTNEFSSGRRITIWKFTGMMIKDRPILGSGIGTYKYNTLRYQAKFFEQGDNRSIYPYGYADKTHNEYLQLWAELGIIGLGIFILIIITYFNYGIRYLKREKDKQKQGIMIGLMGAVVAFLIDSFFWFPLHLSTNVVLFWLIIGLSMVMIIDETRGLEMGKEIEITQKDYDKKERRKKKKERKKKGTRNAIDLKESNIHRFKPILYVVIILLAIFLCITVSRPFIAHIGWYYGNREIKNKNWNEAIKLGEKALKWDPYFGQVYYDIGKILQNKEMYNLALEYFKKAAKYIDDPNLLRDFALIYLEKGQLDKGAIKLRQFISYQRHEKSMVPLYSELGKVYLLLKRYEPAEVAYKEALKIDPKYVNAHYGLAEVYLQQNRLEEALEELQRVVELAPDSEEAKYARDVMQKIAQEKLKDKNNN